jgi:hypothetical protein
MLGKSSFPQISLLLALASRIDAFRQVAQEGDTAWDILCLSGKAGEFRRWSQNDCSSVKMALKGKQCHQLEIRCDLDNRYETIDVSWKVTGNTKSLKIPKAAKAVTTKEYYHRFFVVSEGCHHGNADEDCELPWEAFDKPRVAATGVELLTRRFLFYDAREAGKPHIHMESSKYSAKFYESGFQPLGTGLPVPKTPVFAGSTGTDCAPNVECAAPPSSVEPVLAKELDVTSRFLVESPSDPGHFVLMSNRNTASVQSTYVVEFGLDSKK